MPKEHVGIDEDGYRVEVGWSPQAESVQIATVTHGERSAFWCLFSDSESKAQLAEHVQRAVDEVRARGAVSAEGGYSADTMASAILDALDTASRMTVTGLWVHLTRRTEVNQLIRLVRKARDGAFGRDE